MSIELAVVIGLGGTSFILGYFAFMFRGQQQTGEEQGTARFGDNLSLFFFLMSVIFLNLLMYALLLMTQQAGLTYLQGPVMNIALSLMTYGTVGLLIIFVVWLMLSIVGGIYEWIMNLAGRRRGT